MQVGLGKQLKEIFNIPDTVKLGFLAHVSLLLRRRGRGSARYRQQGQWLRGSRLARGSLAGSGAGRPPRAIASGGAQIDIERGARSFLLQADAKRDDRKAKDRYTV